MAKTLADLKVGEVGVVQYGAVAGITVDMSWPLLEGSGMRFDPRSWTLRLESDCPRCGKYFTVVEGPKRGMVLSGSKPSASAPWYDSLREHPEAREGGYARKVSSVKGSSSDKVRMLLDLAPGEMGWIHVCNIVRDTGKHAYFGKVVNCPVSSRCGGLSIASHILVKRIEDDADHGGTIYSRFYVVSGVIGYIGEILIYRRG